ncbi:MAG: hypothetical protein ABI906_03090 [Pseudomonadota bacterium]
MLSAIVCPLTPRELPTALNNLAFWDTAMPPLTRGEEAGEPRPKLVFSFNGAPDASLSEPLLEAFGKREVVKQSFEAIEVRFCDLPPQKDVYAREGEVKYAPFGRKSGPNWMFFETMKALRDEAEFVFLMETDCQPVIPNWIARLRTTCAQNQDAWIIGSHYCGVSPLHWSIARHINGNALYHIGDPRFWDFLENRFWPWLNDYIVKFMPALAYDCGWEAYLNRVEMEHAGSYDWVRARDILQNFRLSNFVVNLSGKAEQSGDYLWTREEIVQRFPGVAIVHGPMAASTDHRRGPLALGRVSLEGSARLENKALRVEGDLESAAFKRSLWIPGRPLDESFEVTIIYEVDCPKDAGLVLRLCEPGGREMGARTRFGAGTGETQKGKFVQAVTTTAPYVLLALGFHGPDGARIDLSHLRCAVRCNGELLAQTNRVLTD